MQLPKSKKPKFRYGKVAIASIVCTLINLILLDTFSPATLVWLSRSVWGVHTYADRTEVMYGDRHTP
jgi:hypothetical protein